MQEQQVSQPGNDEDLGIQIAVYRGRGLCRSDVWQFWLPGFGAVLAPLGYGVWRSSYAYMHYGPVAAEFWSRPWYLLATFSVAVFALLGLYRISLSRRLVAVHKNGLLLRQGLLRVRRLPWTDLAGIAAGTVQDRFLGLALRTAHSAILYPGAGRPVRLDGSLQALPELVSRIKASLYPRLLPRMQQAFSAGQWLYFGPIAIQREGLRLDRQRFRWEEIDRVAVQAGYLVVELQDRPKKKRVLLSKIPNFELLLQIISQGVTS